jgi:hypothetical protein
LREIMAQKDARIRFLERELAEREKEVENMRESERSTGSDAGDERLRELERKVRELEALVKGLTEEVLDVKSVALNLARQEEERRRKPAAVEPKKAEIQARIEPRAMPKPQAVPEPQKAKSPARSSAVAAGKPPAPRVEDEGDMEMIMQTDGTLRPERRTPSEYIVASAKFETKMMGGKKKGGKGSSDRTLFVEQKKKEVDEIIHAEEDDTLDINGQ